MLIGILELLRDLETVNIQYDNGWQFFKIHKRYQKSDSENPEDFVVELQNTKNKVKTLTLSRKKR